MTRRLPRLFTVAALMCALAAMSAPRLGAYLKLGSTVGTSTVSLKWATSPVRYFVNSGSVPGVSADAFRGALDRAFHTWQDVPTSSVAFEFAGYTDAQPLDDDNISTLGFVRRPDLDRVLASTNFLIDTRTGQILESDVFFNSIYSWSAADPGVEGYYDLQSIATHEIGHFQGLGHSALGETDLRPGGGRRLIAAAAVMFPIAYASGSTTGRALTPDDIAGTSDIYPDAGFRDTTGSIEGRVTLNGKGVYGAHVVAYHMQTGALVGNFTLDDSGFFVIAGLQEGPHVLRVEPLDDADVESFFDDSSRVEQGFTPLIYDKIVVVPRGGAAPSVTVTVIGR